MSSNTFNKGKKDKNMIYKLADNEYTYLKMLLAINNITDKMLLESVLKFIFDSIGSPVSTKKISDTLTSMNRATSNHTVENYISAFLEAFLLYKVDRFDVKGKNVLASGYKYYLVDLGFGGVILAKILCMLL